MGTAQETKQEEAPAEAETSKQSQPAALATAKQEQKKPGTFHRHVLQNCHASALQIPHSNQNILLHSSKGTSAR